MSGIGLKATLLPAAAAIAVLALLFLHTDPAAGAGRDGTRRDALSASLASCSTSDSLADPDQDGIANGYEIGIGTDPCAFDSDGDSCMDGNEIWYDPNYGGDRQPLDSDFYDPDGNERIDLGDSLQILAAFGSPPGSPDSLDMDRWIPDQTKPWRVAQSADGLDLTDVLVNLQSYGHDCAKSMLNPECPAGMTAIKFDSPFNAGTIGPITVTNVVFVDGEPKYFDWTSTVGIDVVYVKSSTTYLTYAYNPEAFSGTALLGPAGPDGPRGISHVLFCYDDDGPTPTVTFSSGTVTPIPDTPTHTATPTSTPVVNTPTRTNTPVVNTPTRTNTPVVNTPTRTNTPTGGTPTHTSTPVVHTPTRTNTPIGNTATFTATPTRTSTPGVSTATFTATPTGTGTPAGPCTPTPEPTPSRNGLVKSIDCALPPGDTLLWNLWLCYDQSDDNIDNNGDSTVDNEPATCQNNGEGSLLIDELIYALEDCDTRNDDDDGDGKPVSNDPESPGYRPECPEPTATDYTMGWVDKDGGELPEGLGSFEFQLKFDHKIFDIQILSDDDWANGRTIDCSMTVITENDIRFGCITFGPPPLGIFDPDGERGAIVVVYPEPDMRYRIRATKDNGVVRRLLDENCEIADVFGDIFPGTNAGLTPDCTDVDITVRRLEADVDIDCDVDIYDQQLMNYRFPSFFGSLMYDQNYDLEPWPNGDFDIDIKDLQYLNGRVGSTCEHPIPDNQWPVPAAGVGVP